jgi:hypothetical protein
VNAELAARRTAAAAVLADYRAAAASAPLSRPPGREWTLRLASMLSLLLDALPGAEDDEEGLEPYCAECGHWLGLFPAAGGWKHYRGDPQGGKRELYDAGPCPVPPPAWRPSPAPSKKPRRPAGTGPLPYCYDCASAAAGACETHLGDLIAADGYDRLAGTLKRRTDDDRL